jgi:CubicO group peptidase (beta-lactamase class C family)
MKQDALQQAVQFAIDHETPWDRSVNGVWGVHPNDPPPWNKLLGPVHDRGSVSGTIYLRGQHLTSWGEPHRADLTFSIAKTYLALLAGVAHDRGLLPDVNEPISRRITGIGFDSGQNADISWANMLQQTSEWDGVCFSFSDQADHYRHVNFAAAPNGKKGELRQRQKPGTYWEYNDVRINQLSLALLHLFKKPLPEVFKEAIMEPVGASNNWQWVGYDNSWVNIAGKQVQSVPGGTHWGAGLSICSEDQAKIGQMILNGGTANGKQVISAAWINKMRTPCEIAPNYGYLVCLNTNKHVFPSVSASSFFAIGAGTSYTWMDPERELVVVVRWIDSAYADAFFASVYKAID